MRKSQELSYLFKISLKQVEPYLTSLALYDLKLNKKITEDFHFDINQPHMKAVIQSIHEHLDPDSESLLDIPPNWLAFPKQVCRDKKSVENVHRIEF